MSLSQPRVMVENDDRILLLTNRIRSAPLQRFLSPPFIRLRVIRYNSRTIGCVQERKEVRIHDIIRAEGSYNIGNAYIA